MPPTPRSRAQNEYYHLIVTVWPSRDHRRLGGDSIRAATGVLSASGEMVEVEDVAGNTYLYPPMLDPSLSVTELLSTAVQSASVVIQWDRDSMDPIDLDLRYAVGEIALLDEKDGGTDVVKWEQRRRLVSGPVTSHSWGDDKEWVSLTIAGVALVDDGDFYAPGAEISSDRFSDITSPGERDRAHKADGLLPPIVYAPVDSEIRAPAMVVVDEVDASSGVSDLTPRRHLLGYRQPTNTSAVEQFQVVDADRDGKMIGTRTDSVYQKAPASDTDGLGDTYWYAPGDFAETFGSSSVTFTAASSTATVTKSRRLCRAGWQVKALGDGADDYLVAISVDGSSVELGNSSDSPVNYGGAGVSNGQGTSIPLPPDVADGCYWIPKLGGVAGDDGGALTNVIDVLLDWLRMTRLSTPVAFGDLEAMRTRLLGLDISWVCRSRQSPWAKALEVLQYLPIRPYLSEGVLRFKWVGTVADVDIVTTINLDSLGSAYRLEPLQWVDEPVYPIIQINYWWDCFDQKFTRSFALDGSRMDWSDAQRIPTGRAVRAYFGWQDVSGIRSASRCPALTLEIDTIEKLHSRGLVAGWLLYRWGFPRHRCTLEIDGSLRWLQPGDVIRVTQTGVTYPSQLWRVEAITLAGTGGGKLLLEGITA